MDASFRQAALDYHRLPFPGKLSVSGTKPMATERDLALAYSPGVAVPCQEIVRNPAAARELTGRGNLVGVVTNGTAVLGLGAIGPLASKPVMEGKAALFKKLAGLDVFDLEVDADDPKAFVRIVRALEPTFGGINLEDIRAPDCFKVEEALKASMGIPVFHDDQHGTAIACAAAVNNALLLQGKRLADIKLVTSGAGAAAVACVRLLISMGLKRSNVTLTDLEGVVRLGRVPAPSRWVSDLARDTEARALSEVLKGVDVFLGLSAPGVLRAEWLPLMADRPVILALANPDPEVCPDEVRRVRPDAIVATGRSDKPNQVNNVLCFPYVFRGALDVGASDINEAMKHAAAEAIAHLARDEPDEASSSLGWRSAMEFGPDYIIPKPFDRRLLTVVAPAVAKAAIDSGVAQRPIHDWGAYTQRLRGLMGDRLLASATEYAASATLR